MQRITRQTRGRGSGSDKQELDPRAIVGIENQNPQSERLSDQQISSKNILGRPSYCTGLNVIHETKEDDFSSCTEERMEPLCAAIKRSKAEAKERPSFCSNHSLTVQQRKMKFLQASGLVESKENSSMESSAVFEHDGPVAQQLNDGSPKAAFASEMNIMSPQRVRDDIAFTKFVTLTPGTTINLARQFHALNEKVNQISEEVMSPYVLTSGINRATLGDCEENRWSQSGQLLCSGLQSAPIERPALSKQLSELPAFRDNEDISRISEITFRSHRSRSNCIGSSPTSLLEVPEEQDHPVFGRNVHENMNKTIYLASARTFLSHVPLWLEQRPFDMRRVREIVRAKKDNPVFPGAISVFAFPEGVTPSLRNPQTMAIFDGQHRCHALNILLEDPTACDITILVEVYLVTSRQQIIDLYVEINKAQPVQEIDIPDAIASVTKRVIDDACSALMTKYPKCFSSRVNCHPPHVHLTTLRNTIFRTEIVENRGIRSSEDLVAFLEAENDKLAARGDEEWGKTRKTAVAKARRYGFFLGLTTCWLEDM